MSDAHPAKKKASKTINVRRADVMNAVAGKVGSHYASKLVDSIIAAGNVYNTPQMELHLASAFGFCDGVRRAVDIAYATREVFPNSPIWLLGAIIHNPEVNARVGAVGLRRLPWQTHAPEDNELGPDDVVIIPAFGVTVGMRQQLEERGVQLVDTTCGNVVKVWQKVKQYARMGVTSIIHGKVKHEESMATASHSRGEDATGKFLIIFSEADAHALADAITGKMSHEEFLLKFKGSYSAGFKPAEDLLMLGMANQTTMLKDETARIQGILREAMVQRDGDEARFFVCDTICGATQDRQNALLELLDKELDAMFIVGGYNSSNTTHLAHIAAKRLPTFFVESAACLESLTSVRAYDLTAKVEQETSLPPSLADTTRPCRIGITAGASCPANVIEAVILRLEELRQQ